MAEQREIFDAQAIDVHAHENGQSVMLTIVLKESAISVRMPRVRFDEFRIRTDEKLGAAIRPPLRR